MHLMKSNGCLCHSGSGARLPAAAHLVAGAMTNGLLVTQAAFCQLGTSVRDAWPVWRRVTLTLIVINVLALPGHASKFELEAAAAKGDIEHVTRLLEAGANPSDGLGAAAGAGQAEVVQLLLEAGAAEDFYKGPSVLFFALNDAAWAGHAQVVQMLLAAGADPSDGMSLAIQAGRTQVVEMLLEAGANPSAGLNSAAGAGNAEMVQMLLGIGGDPNHESSEHALDDAARAGHTEVVRILLESGAKPSSDALDDAVEAGNVQMAQMLLEAGAEPSPRGMDFASGAGNGQIVRMLLEAGANPSHGLLSAAGNGEAEIVAFLLRAGGDPNNARWIYRRRLDLTPLHLAVMKGHLGIVRTLIEAGADTGARARYVPPGAGETIVAAVTSAFTLYLADFEGLLGVEMKDMDGWTPLQFAETAGHAPMIDVLTEASSAPE
ncbi:MAG: ankyrin repeat domain-containing protein [Rhodobacteraceae bacterium]|nr:ankyrin repeat domain-containing protein [Paracoccaceae bacterium]